MAAETVHQTMKFISNTFERQDHSVSPYPSTAVLITLQLFRSSNEVLWFWVVLEKFYDTSIVSITTLYSCSCVCRLRLRVVEQ